MNYIYTHERRTETIVLLLEKAVGKTIAQKI
jgi:hypothetical protein